MLSAPDVKDPLLEGRDTPPLLRRDRMLRNPVDSLAPGLLGDFGAVRVDRLLGSFDVRTTGGLAGSSSRGISSSSRNSFKEG